MRILVLTHDVTDPATRRRVCMLRAGGADVVVAGFRRSDTPISTLEACEVVDFGRTYNARFVQRIGSVIRTVLTLRRHRALFTETDLVIARNLEMLAVAVRGRGLCAKPPALVYECLDIHRLLLRDDIIGRGLRTLEAWLAQRAGLLMTSSPAFVREYFVKRTSLTLPTLLLENKVFSAEPIIPPSSASSGNPPWRIGWFGAIRCRKSLVLLDAFTRAYPGLVEVIIRGKVSYDQLPDFDAVVMGNPALQFMGAYKNPEELAAIYSDVHFSWAIDMFEEGLNSQWLLPNRLYEGGLYHAVPLTIAGTESSRLAESLGIGHGFTEPSAAALTDFFCSLSVERYAQLKAASRAVPSSRWLCTQGDCLALVAMLRHLAKPAAAPQLPAADASLPLLVVIPCLNEAAHIGGLLEYLMREAQHCPMRIVVADGGSTDGTAEIIQRMAAAHEAITYLPNPKRIQSAAVNLAVACYGDGSDYLVRMDAHAEFPEGYCAALRDEALAMQADSVVVALNTVGTQPFQRAVAAAQNSKLGNGGSAHRTGRAHGEWVDHGHHALMRIAAFRAVGGYDESFTHNEDAELDVRLRRAGFRIWLTAKTRHDYYPRATPLALFRQYRQYGRGRLHNLLKHRERPRLRQLLPVAVLPAALLLLLAPAAWILSVPFLAWAAICLGYGALIAYRAGQLQLAMSGVAAMLMHSGWSLGFWQGLLMRERHA